MVLQQPHGCVARFGFAFDRTVGYQHFYLDSLTICEGHHRRFRPGHIPPHRSGRYGALGSTQGRR